mgnify:CR=1 FL=1
MNGSKNTCNCGRFLSELFWLSINQANTVSGMSLHGPYYVGYTLMSSESSIVYFAIRCSFEKKNRQRWFLIILLDIWFLIMSEIWLSGNILLLCSPVSWEHNFKILQQNHIRELTPRSYTVLWDINILDINHYDDELGNIQFNI